LRFIVDSSIFASIIVMDEYYGHAKKFLYGSTYMELTTVDLAFIETANVLWKHTYILNRISIDVFHRLVNTIETLIRSTTKRIYSSIDYLKESLENAVKLGITVYDAIYVTIALRHGYKLATFDEKLDRVLRSKGLDITYIP